MLPWDAVGNFIASLIATEKKEKRIQQWLILLFQMGCSVVGTLMFVTGTTLIATKSFAISVGSGLVSAAVILAYYLRRSPLTRGMMFVFPAGEATEEIKTNVQVIQR